MFLIQTVLSEFSMKINNLSTITSIKNWSSQSKSKTKFHTMFLLTLIIFIEKSKHIKILSKNWNKKDKKSMFLIGQKYHGSVNL